MGSMRTINLAILLHSVTFCTTAANCKTIASKIVLLQHPVEGRWRAYRRDKRVVATCRGRDVRVKWTADFAFGFIYYYTLSRGKEVLGRNVRGVLCVPFLTFRELYNDVMVDK